MLILRRACVSQNFFINGYNGVWTIDHDDGSQVRKTPSWPRSWGNFSLYSCIPTGMHGPTRIFWANLTTFSLTGLDAAGPLVGERHLAFLGPQHDLCGGGSQQRGPDPP